MSDMINFVKTDYESMFNDVLKTVEDEIGEKLSEGDQRKIFLRVLTLPFIQIKNEINYAANNNLLSYCSEEFVDNLGKDIYKTERLGETSSKCEEVFKFSKALEEDTEIKKGIKITNEAGILVFEVSKDYIVKSGETEIKVELESVSTGKKYNGIAAGELNVLIDPINFVESVYNTTETAGGTDKEEIEDYKKRCSLAFESFSTAGPSGAYEYFTYSADNSIIDVFVDSPIPAVVKIYFLVTGGEIPTESIIKKVYDKCSSRDVRPLTDKVEVVVPTEKEYDIELKYYLDKNFMENEGKWRKAIEGNNFDFKEGAIRDFIDWQRKIGLKINKDELQYKIQNAASYIVEGKYISGVRRIEITSPDNSIDILKNEVSKIRSINVVYGGVE